MSLPRSALTILALSLAALPALAEPLVIEEAQVRAVPPGSATSAAFMVLHNPGDEDIALVEARSPAAEVLELHNHVDVDGVMQMRQVPEIVVPAGGSATLAPGGLHLMLIQLAAPLVEGEPVGMTLVFDTGETQSLDAPVQRIRVGDHGHSH
jgi:periplasmic copper chaperone A